LSEISESRNIKDKTNRKAVLSALTMVLHALPNNPDACAIYSDGEELIVEPYDGVRRLYYCGREYEKPPTIVYEPNLLIVIDADEAAVGLSDGERIRVLWTHCSWVPKKHGRGGQSQARFGRAREEALTQWLRKVLEIVKPYAVGKQLIIGGPGMTKDEFIKEFSDELRAQIIRVDSVGYTDENGLYELMGKSRHEKV